MPEEQRARFIRRGILIGLLGGGGIAAFAAALLWGDWTGLFQDLAMELFGAGLTYWLLNRILGSIEEAQEEKEARERRKENLIRRMGSQVNDVAVAAAEDLREEGWLTDGSLQGAKVVEANLAGADLRHVNLAGAELVYANLEGANLTLANLEGANLEGANLEGTLLTSANLEGAELMRANLEGAELVYANLEGANLTEANLEEADLTGVHLEGANLMSANLEGADLFGAKLDGETEAVGQLTQAANLDGAYCSLEREEITYG